MSVVGAQDTVVDLVDAHDGLDVDGLAAMLGTRGWSPGDVAAAIGRALREGRLFQDCRFVLHAS